jgi:putative ABC transport system substrate-binding protein
MSQFWILDFGFSIERSRNKKVFFLSLSTLLLALSFRADAQQRKKVPRIGVIASSTPSSMEEVLNPFRQRLHELGYVEGKNIVFEYRWGEGNIGRFPILAAELVRLKVDVIFTMSTPAAMAVKDATTTIPIVVTGLSDPVATGLVASLDREGILRG